VVVRNRRQNAIRLECMMVDQLDSQRNRSAERRDFPIADKIRIQMFVEDIQLQPMVVADIPVAMVAADIQVLMIEVDIPVAMVATDIQVLMIEVDIPVAMVAADIQAQPIEADIPVAMGNLRSHQLVEHSDICGLEAAQCPDRVADYHT